MNSLKYIMNLVTVWIRSKATVIIIYIIHIKNVTAIELHKKCVCNSSMNVTIRLNQSFTVAWERRALESTLSRTPRPREHRDE